MAVRSGLQDLKLSKMLGVLLTIGLLSVSLPAWSSLKMGMEINFCLIADH